MDTAAVYDRAIRITDDLRAKLVVQKSTTTEEPIPAILRIIAEIEMELLDMRIEYKKMANRQVN